MAVLARDDVDDQPQFRVEDHQRLARQRRGPRGAQHVEAMLGAGEVVAVEEAGPVADQQRLRACPQLIDDRGEGRAGVADQSGTGARFDAIDLVVNGLASDPQGRGHLLEGGVDRGSDVADDDAHKVDDVGEEQLPRVLQLGVVSRTIRRRWLGGNAFSRIA